MRKYELVRLLAAETGVTQGQAKAVLDALPDVVLSLVQAGHPVRFAGLGTFQAVTRQPRKARNLQTGEPVMVPARRMLSFRAERKYRKGV
ncbi:bacterial nucleoid DNA-binding protein [Pelotomaculum thermopropionicum SI]|uniref:Bacterial nucleoid DNA-binding protein n=1 Tax=Pelotomaculum thermopropionicum (strain DSM 13744 / JCM 10971 / SI) TaxID=370438 RepID=A5CZB4_PELTS|nr:bacterial nucleoid DNA-binding protein [Pelotomaculum thermopropionicum SI]